MLPSLALAKPFTNFRDLLKNMTFDKVHTNDHNNELVIDYWSDEYCQDYVYDSEYLPVQECFCDEGIFCAYIDTCHNDFFTLNLYHFDYYNQCHDNYFYEYLHIPTMTCDDHTMFHCSDPDSHDDSSDDNTRNLYDYIERNEYGNDNCRGNARHSENFEIGECKCNNEEGWCAYPIYCNNDFIEVELYHGSSCNNNNFQEILKFEPNTCFDRQRFVCHNHDDGIHPLVAVLVSIASLLVCCTGIILFVRCCCVQNPFGRSNNQQPSQVPVQPQVQMVQQPQGQVPQIMVQQPQGLVQYAVPQQLQQPVYQASAPKQQIIANAQNVNVPVGEVPPAYSTGNYPSLNNDNV